MAPVIGERGAPAAAPATATVSDSDSDHECPEKEPEFVDIADSSQPLIHPLPQLMLQHPAEVVLFPQQAQQLESEYADMHKERTDCLICKIFHCILVLICVIGTLVMVACLPEKYMVFPIVIAVLAVHWLMLDKCYKEQC